MRTLAIGVLLLFGAYPACAQEPVREARRSEDVLPKFQSGTFLVLVPVVVRDGAGRAVGNLRREDFKVFEAGKQQAITKFSAEGWGLSGIGSTDDRTNGVKLQPEGASQPATPERFVAYLFDDLHMRQEDWPRVRSAALRHLDAMLPGDRAAIYTVSGRVAVEFTGDRDVLRQALERLRPKHGPSMDECLDLEYYLADRIDRGDREALSFAIRSVAACYGQNTIVGLATLVKMTARQKVFEGQTDARLTLTMLRNVVRRTETAPGQRTIVLVSDGFYLPPGLFDQSDVFDAATRGNVTVNCLNSRGLIAYTPYSCPASRSCVVPVGPGERNFEREGDAVHDGVLAEIAAATGGGYLHNSNDYEGGFRRLAAAPEAYYVLGFSPSDLKLDGKFHLLKVTLADAKGRNITARRGYYAAARMADAEEAAKQELNDALYSRADIGGLPFDVRSRAYKSPDGKDALEVSAHLDPKDLRMRSEGGMNRKPLTIVFGLFDGHGNIRATTRKDVGLQIRDVDLKTMPGRWVEVKATFRVKPGEYMIRVVVRDGDEHLLSAVGARAEVK